jgi:hypothetical protein
MTVLQATTDARLIALERTMDQRTKLISCSGLDLLACPVLPVMPSIRWLMISFHCFVTLLCCLSLLSF